MKKLISAIILSLILAVAAGSAQANWDPRDKAAEEQAVKETIDRFLKLDPTLQVFFDKAAGYAVLPTVGKGAFIAGFGYGRGWLYEAGKPVGKVSLHQLSAGAQIGGQAYSEIIFIRDKDRLDAFKYQQFEFGAQATAVVVTAGIGKGATYKDGVAVFILPKAGLMAELSLSGQRMGFEPFEE